MSNLTGVRERDEAIYAAYMFAPPWFKTYRNIADYYGTTPENVGRIVRGAVKSKIWHSVAEKLLAEKL